MALPLGPGFHSISRGGEWEAEDGIFPSSGWEGTRRRGPRARRCGGQAQDARHSPPHPRSRAGGRGSAPRAPPSFVQLRILPVHAILRHFPWGGGWGPASPRGEGPEAPAPPSHAGLPTTTTTIVPRGWGEGAAVLRSAPPHPPPRRKPRGPPLPPPRGSRPWRRPPPPHKERRGGGGGPAYRDVRNALLALVRHGPAGALGPAGGPVGAVFRSARLSTGPAPRGRGD